MAKNRTQKLEDIFDMVIWAPNKEKFNMNLLIDYGISGKFFETGCQSAFSNEIAFKLSKFFGKSFSYMKVLKKFEYVRKQYKTQEVVTFWPCVRFNIANNKCVASDATWEAIVKAF